MSIICINAVNASDVNNFTLKESDIENCLQTPEIQMLELESEKPCENNHLASPIKVNSSEDLENNIINANDGDEITIEKGTYYINNITITKNLTLKGNGNPSDIVIDAQNKSSIFLIRNSSVHFSLKNMTFINGFTYNFGGAISMETGHVYVDNCVFINNTALNDTNAGGISNYGTEDERGYLLVNNSLFINNHADHDGGAVTTCFADSDIYNSVFIGNSAHRDGGAIRVSVQGYGNVQDCVFMYNHADEWGGAYYSWSGESNIVRCIFMNNTAGTNGGAIMVSGNINLEYSIIVNNSGGLNGGSIYIQQPMYDAVTSMNIHHNLITNNSARNGQEIFIKWKNVVDLYTDFNNNDWGDEDPNDPAINDPNKVTERSEVKTTTKSDLLDTLNLNLVARHSDSVGDYFPEEYLNNIIERAQNTNENKQDDNTNSKQTDGTANSSSSQNNNPNIVNKKGQSPKDVKNEYNPSNRNVKEIVSSNNNNTKTINSNEININTEANINSNITQSFSESNDNKIVVGNSTSVGTYNNAYELNEHKSISKAATSNANYFILPLLVAILALIIGYRKEKIKYK